MPFPRINFIPPCCRLRIFPWAVFLLLLPSRAVHAQNEDLRFSHISIRDGLSQSTVLSIIQDSRGFLWFGTEDGLNRYDGYDFTIFKYDPHAPSSLSYNYINTLCESVDGDLWIGTFGGGLNRFDRDTETFTRFRDMMSNPSSLTNDYVNAILQDREGRIWVGTQNGLNRLDPGGEHFSHYFSGPEGTQKLEKNYISVLLEDGRGCLWIGTQDGLYSWDRANDRLVQKEFGQEGRNSPDPKEITCLFEGKTGVL